MICLSITIFAGIMESLSVNFWMYLFFQTLGSLGQAGCFQTGFILALETVGKSHRYVLFWTGPNYFSPMNFAFISLSNNFFLEMQKGIRALKLNYRKTVFYFALNFLPWEFLLIKKLDFKKTNTTQYTTFKTDIIKVVLVFLASTFLQKKIPREGN